MKFRTESTGPKVTLSRRNKDGYSLQRNVMCNGECVGTVTTWIRPDNEQVYIVRMNDGREVIEPRLDWARNTARELLRTKGEDQ